jgi:PilZ domain
MDSPNPQPSPAAQPGQDRRHFSRYTLQVQIEIHREGSSVPMRLATTDLSRAGCYIELMMPFPVGAHVRATFWLDDFPIVVHGRVATSHPQFGNGIMFEKFEGQAEQLLGRYLDGVTT